MKRKKSKKQRKQWWNRLTLEQQAEYIEKRQAQKAEERKNSPPKELKFNPKCPWLTEGINDTNREQWLARIEKKNPWLKVDMLVWLLLYLSCSPEF